MISLISDMKFSHSGSLMTRHYLTIRIWDLNKENRPFETSSVYNYLCSKLCSALENDCIFELSVCVMGQTVSSHTTATTTTT